jgi:hypothetical protein
MVSLQTAENALKTYYLGVVSEQLNTSINPLLAKIKQSTSDVWGKEIRKVAPYGLNGGVGAGTETGDLPVSGENTYAQFVLTLKNLYGTIEISDKAIRASSNSAGAFVNLLNAEMEGLLRASSFNFGRMLYGDGSGILAGVISCDGFRVEVDSTKYLMEGMIIDILEESPYGGATPIVIANRIRSVDRDANSIRLFSPVSGVTEGHIITVQGSYMNEITGLGSIYKKEGYLYGLKRSDYKWMTPYIKENAGEVSDLVIQAAIDKLEEESGSMVDFIVCSSGVKRAYQSYLTSFKHNIDVLNLEGGYKAISYNGIPVVSDRFVEEGTMYLLNTKDFTLHQLCDWSWLEGDDGRVIRQIPGKPVFTATLVKYCDLICDRPYGQAKITGITEC